MKKMIGQFFIILTLVLTSINVCFPNDVDCSDNAYSSSSTSPNKNSKSSGAQEDHHCFGMTCNILMTSFSNEVVQSNVVIISQQLFSYKLSTYPQISISTDKPPTV